MSVDVSCISLIGYSFENIKDFYNLPCVKERYFPESISPTIDFDWDLFEKDLYDLSFGFWIDGYNDDGYLVFGAHLSDIDTEEFEMVEVIDNIQEFTNNTIEKFKTLPFIEGLNGTPKFISFLQAS